VAGDVGPGLFIDLMARQAVVFFMPRFAEARGEAKLQASMTAAPNSRLSALSKNTEL
jgi:hypothetical protein